MYALYNLKKNKIYVGRSSNIKNRMQQHKYNFKVNNKVSPMYLDDINDFVFIVLQKIPSEFYLAFGHLYELAHIYKLLEWHIELYNLMGVEKSATRIEEFIGYHFMYDSGSREAMIQSFKTQLDIKPWEIKRFQLDDKSIKSIKRYYSDNRNDDMI